MTLSTLLLIGGVCHFGILAASALVPRVLNFKTELQNLPRLMRQMIWVHGAFIVLTIIGLGAISIFCAADLAAGSRIARGFCGFVAIFWLARLAMLFVFDAKPYLGNQLLRVAYHTLTTVFVFLVLVYGWAALNIS